MPVYILAIESSCDDTSVAVLKNDEVLSNVTCNQLIHEQYGGVVPELASRDHLKNIIPTIDSALTKANIQLNQLKAIAVTKGPGLIGSLLVGVSTAKTLALTLNIPLIEVNHLQAHVLAHFIKNVHPHKKLDFPFIGFIVSGGHTQLLLVNDFFNYKLLGETLDDAAGEALDKGAKLLGLGFPGGPLIDKIAKNANPNAFPFPLATVQPTHFSFSGIKTALLYLIQKEQNSNPDFITSNLADLCASYQATIVKMLINGLKQAIDQTNVRKVAIAGGVSANSKLREELVLFSQKHNVEFFMLPMEYCTDNAAMIGIVGYHKYLKQEFASLDIMPVAKWEDFINTSKHA